MLATHSFAAAVAAILFYPHIHLCRYHVPRTGSTTVGTRFALLLPCGVSGRVVVTRPPNRLLWSRELPQARREPGPRAVAYGERSWWSVSESHRPEVLPARETTTLSSPTPRT